MQASGPIRVKIMHSDSVMCFGMGAILSQQEDMQLSSATEGQAGHAGADVIVTDYRSGMRLCDEAQANPCGHPRILVITPFDKEWTVRHAVNRGVHGYLLQNCGPDELVRAVHALNGGRRFLSDAVAHCVVDSLKRSTLTGRETEVLQLLAQGLCNKNIARDLGIGLGTVKTHLKGIMGKLDATARTHALVVAARRGLIDTDFAPRA